jgi:hypothetical protein
MQEIVEQLKTKAGLTEEQAVKALETMSEFIKSKVPPMMHGMIDSFMGSSAGNIMNDMADKAKEMGKEATEKMSDWGKKSADAAHDAMDKLKGFMNHDKK